jgi:hypothetical protein
LYLRRSTYPYRSTPVDRRSHENRPYYKHPEMVFFPSWTPVEGIIGIIRRLWYKDDIVSCAVTGSMLEIRNSLGCGGYLLALLFTLIVPNIPVGKEHQERTHNLLSTRCTVPGTISMPSSTSNIALPCCVFPSPNVSISRSVKFLSLRRGQILGMSNIRRTHILIVVGR